MPTPTIEKRLIGTLLGMRIYTVDGEAIRGRAGQPVTDVDFTMGGNPARYPRYVPAGEVWIDRDLSPLDATATVLHELVEYFGMAHRGMTYNMAHDLAAAREAAFRRTLAGVRKIELGRVRAAYHAD